MTASDVRLQPWSERDFPLLERLLGDPEMTRYLGGPETPEQLASRHQRYLNLNKANSGRMLTIVLDGATEPVGSIGYWDSEEHGETFYETGWSVLPEFQGRGIASKAIAALLPILRAQAKHRYVHAFPNVDNGPSNAICRKAGFTLLETADFEYPKGHWMLCHNWRFDLQTL